MSPLRSKARITLVATVCGACAKILDLSPATTSRNEPTDSVGGAGDGGEAEHAGRAGSALDRAGQSGEPGAAGAGQGGAIDAGGAGGRDDAGTGGMGSGGEGNAVANGGAGNAAASGGAGNAAASGGAGNVAGTGGSANATGDGGEAGGGAPEWPRYGAPCSVPGKFACHEPAGPFDPSQKRFVCRDGAWAEATPCTQYYYCDRRTGTCGQQACDGEQPTACAGNEVQVCGPDLVTLTYLPCDFDCDAVTNDCSVQTTNQLLIDRVGGPREEGRPWPYSAIAVCFRDVPASTTNDALREAIRHAVETSWGRHLGVTFLGWNDCSESIEGVELSLLDDCEGKLAVVPRTGFPGAGSALSLGLCRSYFDVQRTRYPQPGSTPDLDLIAFVAKHVFGHALGLDDVVYDKDWSQLMEQGLDVDQFESIDLSWTELEYLGLLYGEKPPQALFTPSGRCLAATAGELEGAPCDGAEKTRWQLTPAGIVHGATGDCLSADADSVIAGTCTGIATDEAFRPRRVRWRAALNRCVSERIPPSGESPLAVSTCNPSWPAAQRFRFELLDDARVRIHAASGACVRWPADWTFPARPELGACDGERDSFEARDGRIAIQGRCLQPITFSGLEFRACYADAKQHLFISGPLELGTSALTLGGSADSPQLLLTPPTSPPSDAQVFDYHF